MDLEKKRKTYSACGHMRPMLRHCAMVTYQLMNTEKCCENGRLGHCFLTFKIQFSIICNHYNAYPQYSGFESVNYMLTVYFQPLKK